MMLEDYVFGRRVILIRQYSGLQDVLLRSLEVVGGRDEIGGEAAGEEITRGTGGKQENYQK
jgi:hypothetical protein